MPSTTACSLPVQNKQSATPWYSDQVLPFDITLSGANEYGAMCAAKIFGVEILNEGWGISIDDAVSEMQATFVARVVEPMSAVASPFLIKTRSLRPVPDKKPRGHARTKSRQLHPSPRSHTASRVRSRRRFPFQGIPLAMTPFRPQISFSVSVSKCRGKLFP